MYDLLGETQQVEMFGNNITTELQKKVPFQSGVLGFIGRFIVKKLAVHLEKEAKIIDENMIRIVSRAEIALNNSKEVRQKLGKDINIQAAQCVGMASVWILIDLYIFSKHIPLYKFQCV